MTRLSDITVEVSKYNFDAVDTYVDSVSYRNQEVAAWVCPATSTDDGHEGLLVWVMDNPLADDNADSVSNWDRAHWVEL